MQEGEYSRQACRDVTSEALVCCGAAPLHKCHCIVHKGANKEFRMYQMLLFEGCFTAGPRQKKLAIRYMFRSLSAYIWSSF